MTLSALDPPPATTPVERPPSIGARLASMVYEGLILAAVLFVAAFLFVGLLHYPDHPSLRPLFRLYLFGIVSTYFVWFWGRGGQTVPMKTWKLRLTRWDGGPVEPWRAMARSVVAAVGIGLAGITILWAWLDPDRQFLHDRLVGTRIRRA